MSTARIDRRYAPLDTTPSWLKISLLCAVGFCLGVGAFGWGYMSYTDQEPWPVAQGFLLAVPVLLAVWVWLLGKREAALRVGASGVAREDGDVARMPWFGVAHVERVGDGQVRISGTTEQGDVQAWLVSLRAHMDALAHITREAHARVPRVLALGDMHGVLLAPRPVSGVPVADELVLVGKRCTASGKVLSIVTEARACGRCGRPYHKSHVPGTCACGASLSEPGALLYG